MAGHATIAALERANLFIVPLDDERRWYRYHHLFADVLRQRLHQRFDTARDDTPGLAELHERASIWYEDHGLTHDAFQHAVAAGEFERAAGLAERARPAAFRNSFQNTVFLGWMRVLPDELIRSTIALARATHASAIGDGETAMINVWQELALMPETDYFGRAGAFALLGVACLRSGNLEEAAAAFTSLGYRRHHEPLVHLLRNNRNCCHALYHLVAR